MDTIFSKCIFYSLQQRNIHVSHCHFPATFLLNNLLDINFFPICYKFPAQAWTVYQRNPSQKEVYKAVEKTLMLPQVNEKSVGMTFFRKKFTRETPFSSCFHEHIVHNIINCFHVCR